MGNLYQEPDGSYTDENGVKLIYNPKTDRFYYENGEMFIEDFMQEEQSGVGQQAQAQGQKQVPSKVQETPKAQAPAQSAGSPAVPEQESKKAKKSKSAPAKEMRTKAPEHMEGMEDIEDGGLGEVALGAQLLLANNLPLTLITALILSWLHPIIAGVGAYLVLNSGRMKGGIKALCMAVIVLATIYSTSIETILQSSYSSGEAGANEDIAFVLSLGPGSTSLKEFQNIVRKTTYTTTSDRNNNTIAVDTPTVDCVVFFDKDQTTINAIEVKGSSNYIATIYPLNVHVLTNASTYVLNLSEIDVGGLLNGLESRTLPSEEYIYNLVHGLPLEVVE